MPPGVPTYDQLGFNVYIQDRPFNVTLVVPRSFTSYVGGRTFTIQLVNTNPLQCDKLNVLPACGFDLDGDLDMAMIAFYAEPIMPTNESFLYFQNQGNLNFKVSNLNIPFGGRWMVMDAGDADQDGDLDILLGNFQFGAPKKGKVKPGLQLDYIENKIH
jgi:hypothetical protein